jgi:hypothetical protein
VGLQNIITTVLDKTVVGESLKYLIGGGAKGLQDISKTGTGSLAFTLGTGVLVGKAFGWANRRAMTAFGPSINMAKEIGLKEASTLGPGEATTLA